MGTLYPGLMRLEQRGLGARQVGRHRQSPKSALRRIEGQSGGLQIVRRALVVKILTAQSTLFPRLNRDVRTAISQRLGHKVSFVIIQRESCAGRGEELVDQTAGLHETRR